jgi:predicted Zn-ribbon and HTH transcriptional regulator
MSKMLKWANSINPSDIESLFTQVEKEMWYEIYDNSADVEKTMKRLSPFAHYIQDKRVNKIKQSLSDYKKIKNQLKQLEKVSFILPLPFNEAQFTSNLERFIQDVTEQSAKVESLLGSIPAEVGVSLIEELMKQYINKANMLSTTKLPTNMEKNYRKSIESALKNIAKQFYRKSYKTRQIITKTMKTKRMRRKAAFWKGDTDDHLRELNKKTSLYITYDPQLEGL